ncbi:MAG: DUF4124 domain-containing protein [Aquabacterium sp.]|nr:DUF4124 domain-containing protein [Aquabacterium sp.]
MAGRAWRLAGVALWVLALPLAAAAQGSTPSAAGIYSCVDAQGRRLTSDRPIPDCVNREQRVLNRDGSVQRTVPPTLTAEERAEREAAQRRADLARAAQADAVRRDRNLMVRYPSEAAHHKAREASLDTVRLAMRASEQRVKALAAERKPLLDEAEFYAGRQIPPRLKQQLDANDAGVAAQRLAAANQELELARINNLYDAELDRLRRLWAGALPGSLPPADVAVSPAAPSSRR